MDMLQKLRDLIDRHPYLTAVIVASIFNLGWLTTRPLRQGLAGFILSGLLVGFPIGMTRVKSWLDVVKKFPLAVLCFFLVAIIYGAIGIAVDNYGGDMGGMGMVLIVMPSVTAIASPMLLIGGTVGWIFRQRNCAI